MKISIFKKALVLSFGVTGFLSFSSMGFAAPMPSKVAAQSHPDAGQFSLDARSRLAELHNELDNLKTRQVRMSGNNKNKFSKALDQLEGEWAAAHQYQISLRNRPTPNAQSQMKKMIAQIEKDIDTTENHFSESGFGLGGLLGL